MLGTISGLGRDKQIIHREMTNKTLEEGKDFTALSFVRFLAYKKVVLV
jgi:hypothetical protein